jgi:hypothetical protein
MSKDKQYFFMLYEYISRYGHDTRQAVIDEHPTSWLADELAHPVVGQAVRLLFWSEITREQYVLLEDKIG